MCKSILMLILILENDHLNSILFFNLFLLNKTDNFIFIMVFTIILFKFYSIIFCRFMLFYFSKSSKLIN
jgi:hypothetical protein